jgi:hypothetical protein
MVLGGGVGGGGGDGSMRIDNVYKSSRRSGANGSSSAYTGTGSTVDAGQEGKGGGGVNIAPIVGGSATYYGSGGGTDAGFNQEGVIALKIT